MLGVVSEEPNDGDDHTTAAAAAPTSLIDQIVRDGARRMLAEALQAEVEGYIAEFVAERDENGRRLVVRNGCHQRRRGGGDRTADQRPPHRPRHRRAAAVLLGDPAAVVPQDLRTEDAFHVVVPSLPGMGFSTPMVGKWTMERAANIRRPIHGRPVIETTERTR
jgi:hypothetical protein